MRMSNFLKFLLTLFLIVSLPVVASAQVFDPLSKSAGGTMTAPILWSVGVPTITNGTLVAGGDNLKGVVTAGSSTTSIVITFGHGGYATAPSCVVVTQAQITSFAYAVTTTAITITQTSTSGNLVNYRCDVTS